ncbi:MAG: SAM-dependent methyltransferase [Lachnospiraceae bacterium]|jgi:tRNA (cmo5U34)-methyltransferase|nr:SAM-dependent methyltransferase [Lachnospiraceae bacterium]
MSENSIPLEGMEEFYNIRALGYDEHMRNVVKNFDKFYHLFSNPIKSTNEQVKILDLGCGTGAELKEVLIKCPNAQITCVDIAEEMLKMLHDKYNNKQEQFKFVHSSYETIELKSRMYDYALCAMCLHHYPYERKVRLLNKVLKSLKYGGVYIEADFIVTPQEEREELVKYHKLLERHKEIEYGDYDVDAPACIATEIKIFADAGFSRVDVIYKEENQAVLVGYVD